jgi:hypothetical protein
VDLTQRTGAPPAYTAFNNVAAIYSPQFNSKRYAYFDSQGFLIELHVVVNGTWGWTNITQNAGMSPLGIEESPIGIDSKQFGSIQYLWAQCALRRARSWPLLFWRNSANGITSWVCLRNLTLYPIVDCLNLVPSCLMRITLPTISLSDRSEQKD